MKRAIEIAKQADGEIPVGAIIVKDDEIIASAFNRKEELNDVTAHAEILAIREASRKLNRWRLDDCEMYVTLEPCSMCASAIAQARISKLHIGTFNKDMGACGTILNILDYDIFNSYVEINWCYNKECSELISKFFYEIRK